MTDSPISGQPTPRAQARARTQRRILELGREHLATYGAAALSLRAIARDLDLVSSAVYRYVASRDDLLTLLVVDAYTELADRVLTAHSAAPADDAREQLRLSCRAFRDWAVAEPARYALLYGSPVPGYQAPAEQTTEPGTRVVGSLFGTIAEGIVAGEIPSSAIAVGGSTSTDFDGLRDEFGFAGDDAAVMKCLTLWGGLVGAISLEVFGQYGADTLTQPGDLFEHHLRVLEEVVGLG